MKIRYINPALCCLIAVLLLLGCAKDERLLFDEQASVYFGPKVDGPSLVGIEDSLNYSFAFRTEDFVRDTFYVHCRITGLPVDRDRRINIVADENADAKLGYHYEILESIIPAGKYDNSVPIVLHRRPGLRDSTVTALLRIEDSEDLLAGYNDIGTGPVYRNKYPRREFKFTITDRLVKPANWDSSWLPVFGTYSEVKIRFISNATDFTDWTGVVYPQDRNFIVQTAYYALYAYEQENGDLIDENGNPVKFY